MSQNKILDVDIDSAGFRTLTGYEQDLEPLFLLASEHLHVMSRV